MLLYVNLCWCSYFVFNLCVFHCKFIWQAEKKTYTHRQTEKKGAWGRPRLWQTILKCYFLRSFVTCHERATAWLFHVGARQNYCVSHLSSRRSIKKGEKNYISLLCSATNHPPSLRRNVRDQKPYMGFAQIFQKMPRIIRRRPNFMFQMQDVESYKWQKKSICTGLSAMVSPPKNCHLRLHSYFWKSFFQKNSIRMRWTLLESF